MSRFIQLRTDIPGPRSRQIMERAGVHLSRQQGHFPLVIERGEGALVTDVDGNSFIDLSSGAGALAVGHAPPRVGAALHDQVDQFLGSASPSTPCEQLVDLAERLNAASPISGPNLSTFCGSGPGAVCDAISIARAHTGKQAIIGFEGAVRCASFGYRGADLYRIPYAYCYRCPYQLQYPGCDSACAGALERALAGQVVPEETAAVVVEPVQVRGGTVVPPKAYLQKLERICRDNDILFIVDEVDTGFGFAGALFASQVFGLDPDLICIGGSMGAGIPMGGVVGRAEIMAASGRKTMTDHGVGSPLGCVAALEVLDTIEQDNLTRRAADIGRRIQDRWLRLSDQCQIAGDIRGLGAMAAMELVRDRATREPADDLLSEVVKRCTERGVIAQRTGIYDNVISLMVPLVTTDEQLDEGLLILEGVIHEMEQSRAGTPSCQVLDEISSRTQPHTLH